MRSPATTFGALSAALCLEARADAVALPPLALGNTSFMDGVSRPSISSNCPCNTFGRTTPATPAGIRFPVGNGFVAPRCCRTSPTSARTPCSAPTTAVLLPLVRLDLDIDGGGRPAHRQGDLIVSPLMLQWGPLRCSAAPTGSA